MRLTETVILWFSDDQNFWEEMEAGHRRLGTDDYHTYTGGLFAESQAKAWHINENELYVVWKSFKKWSNLKRVPNGLILTLQVLNHVGGLTIHGKAYSKESNSCQNILSLMCLENIHDFGHSKEQIPLMFADGTHLELSPESVLLHQVSEKSQNYHIRFLMQSTSLGIITHILKEVKNWK
ncbi:hypothetical protein ACS0TY_001863 [Phlomoides rotata]